MNILNTVINILNEYFTDECIDQTTNLKLDLGIDSFDMFQIMCKIEQSLNINIDTIKFQYKDVQTVGELAEYIQGGLKE